MTAERASGPPPPIAPAASRFDPLLPAETAAKAEDVGVRKAAMAATPMFLLGVLAGAFIALAAALSTTAVAGSEGFLSFGVVRLVAGVTFSLGLILVVLGGAELFTGSNLLAMAWASRHITTRAVLRNWVIVYVGNFVGSLATATLMVIAGQYEFGGGVVGETALATAVHKVGLEPLEAFTLGILCNGLVCLAVWLAFSARTAVDKVVVIVPPIAAFVAMGFEHSVANMYFIPVAMLIRAFAPQSFWTEIGATPDDYAMLDLNGLVTNLAPVTLGNIVGGTILVGAVYWLVYIRAKA
jgi:formate transporter